MAAASFVLSAVGIEVEWAGQGVVVGSERGRALGVQPPDEPVVGEVAVAVGERGLGLADAAQPGDRLGEDGRALALAQEPV